MSQKSCSTCKIVKPLNEFGKHSKAKDGKRSQCKSCEAEYRLKIKLTTIIVKEKICSTCKINKEVSEFNKNVSQKDGYCNRCRDCCNKHYRENSDKILNRNLNYRIKNKTKLSESKRKKYKETYSDTSGKLTINISNLIRDKIKRGGSSIRFYSILGCSVEEFKSYIESQFLPWMSWENHGNVCEKLVYNCSWDLDHIIPLYIAKTEEELKILNHWSNFQPLCSRINRADKNKKVYPVTNLELKITINKHKQIMNYKNYSISAGKGKLYLKEKQPTPGYEEVSYGTEGKKTYHQYHNSITGVPTIFETKEITHDGKTLKFIELTLIDGDNNNKVSAPLKNQKGNYTDEAKALISALNNLKFGEPVTLSVKSTTTTGKNNKEYKNLNIYINYVNIMGDNGKGLSTGFIPYTDIPAPIEKVVAGDKTWDWSPQTEFFYSKLQEIQEKFKSGVTQPSNTQQEIPKSDPLKVDKIIPASKLDEYDDELPF